MAHNKNLLVDFKNVKIMFKSKRNFVQAVRGIDLQVFKGQIVGIVGESGSGKSVLVRSIIGFNPNSKVIADSMHLYDQKEEYDEKTKINKIIDVTHSLQKFKKEKQWKQIRGRVVSYIPQNPLSALNPTKKISAQLFEAFEVANKMGRYKNDPIKTTKERAISVLNFIGIHDPIKVLKSYPHELSGGMRQRIVIAMTVAMKPNLIIADEPTTALDVSVQAKVIDIIKKINRELNIAVIFISHDISLVANFVDFVYVLYAGKIMEKGTTPEVFGDPRHPYTWALLSAIPDRNVKGEIKPIIGTPPNLINLPVGDIFASRNKYALKIDFQKEPPLFQISNSHYAATWLLHPDSPKVELEQILIDKLEFIREAFAKGDQIPPSTLFNAITNKLPTNSTFYKFANVNTKISKEEKKNV